MSSTFSNRKIGEKIPATTLKPLREDTIVDDIFRIFIRNAKGDMTTLDASTTDTVKDVKVKVRKTSRVPWNMLRLYFQGEQLQDDRLLSDYNIQRASTLYLYFRYSWDGFSLEDARCCRN